MGAVPHSGGVSFRVWAPHATAVSISGTFSDWAEPGVSLQKDAPASDEGAWAGTWSVDLVQVAVGVEYRYRLETPAGVLWRMDPYARQVTGSTGNAMVYDPDAFDWGEQGFLTPAWNRTVIYEMHVGTFAAGSDRPGTFDRAIRRMPYLRELGIGAIQVMPPFEHAGDVSWGYNPAHIFAIESTYGGPDAFKRFIRAAHEQGIAVIVDVVYNHLGPSDLDLWRFDGWAEGEWGGIYFYNDERAVTPWGNTRPDYGRGEVRTFLRDSALTWLEEFRADGLRFDSTLYIRTVDETPETALPDGWSFLAWLNDEIRARQPWKLTIAEDLGDAGPLVAPTDGGGAGFGAHWEPRFLHLVRDVLTAPADEDRALGAIVEALLGGGQQPFSRVIYTESHDDVANGQVRLAEAVAPGDAANWFARKRATLGAAITLTAPGIPMLFQGQELLEDGWFDDTIPLDWSKARRFAGLLQLQRDLIALRRNTDGRSAGLSGPSIAILHADEPTKLLAWHRWLEGGPGDDVVVVINLSTQPLVDVPIALPRAGRWRVRLNSDSVVYDDTFDGQVADDLEAIEPDIPPGADPDNPGDGPARPLAQGWVSVGAYGLVILSQDP
jgi:1,4-alpha-glucan branching enzyme